MSGIAGSTSGQSGGPPPGIPGNGPYPWETQQHSNSDWGDAILVLVVLFAIIGCGWLTFKVFEPLKPPTPYPGTKLSEIEEHTLRERWAEYDRRHALAVRSGWIGGILGPVIGLLLLLSG